jgi:hypothetical protein
MMKTAMAEGARLVQPLQPSFRVRIYASVFTVRRMSDRCSLCSEAVELG